MQSKTIASGTDYQYKTTYQDFQWEQCSVCMHCYINPIPIEEELERIYPKSLKNYRDFDEKPGIAFGVKNLLDANRLKKIICNIKSDEGRFLDVGCAAGMLLDVVKNNCPKISIFHGIEISEEAGERANSKGYNVQISTIENAKIPENYYDLITMQQVIEHVHNPKAVLEKLHKSLRAGGQLVMDTPLMGSWDQMLFSQGYWEGYHIPRHFNIWTVHGMSRMLKEANFSKIKYIKRIKPVHWTLSIQNWAIATQKPSWIIDFFNIRNPFLLVVFGVIDVFQLALFNKASDVQYIAEK